MARNQIKTSDSITATSSIAAEFKPIDVTLTINNASVLRRLQRACYEVSLEGNSVGSFDGDVDEAVDELLCAMHKVLEKF